MDLFKVVEKATTKERVEEAKKLIKDAGKDVAHMVNGPYSDSLLHVAAQYSPDLISTLCKFIKPDVQNKHGVRPLHIAVRHNETDSIKKLLKNDASFNAKDDVGNTPMHYAALYNEGLVKKFSKEKYGADPRIKNAAGKTPLDIVIDRGGKVEKKKKSSQV